MKMFRRTIVAVTLTIIVALGFTGVAGALDYNPVVCTNGLVAVDDACVEVQGTVVVADQTDPATAVSAAGTLPYTGSNSSLPVAEIGVALLAAGGLIVVMVRRHQVADQS